MDLTPFCCFLLPFCFPFCFWGPDPKRASGGTLKCSFYGIAGLPQVIPGVKGQESGLLTFLLRRKPNADFLQQRCDVVLAKIAGEVSGLVQNPPEKIRVAVQAIQTQVTQQGLQRETVGRAALFGFESG